MFAIDGMNAIEAGYHYAGIAGLSPRGMTLRQLWMMAEGVTKAGRRKTFELATLVWSLGSIDVDDYLHFGVLSETGSGGPVQLTPEMQARVAEAEEKIRRENPGLPTVKGLAHG